MRPVIILAAPRSFSSLTANIFYDHGCWIGTCRAKDNFNPKGYYENLKYKQFLKENCGALANIGKEAEYKPDYADKLIEIRNNDGYKDGPWLVKHSAMYWKIWKDLKPHYISVRRNTDSIINSGKSTGYIKNPHGIHMHVELMDNLEKNGISMRLDAKNYFTGDYSQISEIMKECGLTFNPYIAENIIDEDLNNFGT